MGRRSSQRDEPDVRPARVRSEEYSTTPVQPEPHAESERKRTERRYRVPGGRMKKLLLLIFLVSAAAFGAEQSKAPARKSGRDALTFKNGDILFGSLTSIDSENGIKWSRADALNQF